MFTQTSVVLFLWFTFLFAIYFYLTRHFKHWEKKGVKTHGRPFPLVGNLYKELHFTKSAGETLKDIYDEHKGERYVGLYLVDTPALLIRDLQLVKSILNENFHSFCDRRITAAEKYDPVVANTLLFMKNPNWKTTRTSMSPIFSSGKFKLMFSRMKLVGKDLMRHLTEVSIHEEWTEAKELFAEYSTDVIGICIFGMTDNCIGNKECDFRKISKLTYESNIFVLIRQTLFFVAPRIAEFFRFTLFNQRIYDFLGELCMKVFQERYNDVNGKGDFWDYVIAEDKKKFNETGRHIEKNWLSGQAATIYFGGFEATASVISFTLYEVCINSKVQNKLRTEIHKHYKSVDDVSFESISNLKYLHMVITETLRKYPVFHFLDRECTEDFRIPETDVVIEKGTPIIIPLFGFHYDPEFFPNPEKFDPDRYSDENKDSIIDFPYLAFGSGPRKCIGERFSLLAVKLILIQILFDFEVSPVSNTPIPVKIDLKQITIQSKDGLPMKFKKFVKE